MQKRKLYYEILDIPISADLKTIHAAYLKKARELHPSRASLECKLSALAGAKISEIIEAYQVLRDENKRREYDKWMHTNSLSTTSADDYVQHLDRRHVQAALSREEVREMMASVLMRVRQQILDLDANIVWEDIGLVDSGFVLESQLDKEHFIVQTQAIDVLRVVDLEKMVTDSVFDLPAKVKNCATNYLLSIAVCLHIDADELIRAYVFNFNRATLENSSTGDIIMMAIINLEERVFYFPFISSFKPNFLTLKLPSNYKIDCS